MLGISSCATRYRDLEQDDWSATWVDLRMSHARPAGVLEPTQRTNPAERNSRVRPFHLIAIFAAVVATQLVSVVPARAAVDDLACSYDHVSYNACLDFEDVGEPGSWTPTSGWTRSCRSTPPETSSPTAETSGHRCGLMTTTTSSSPTSRSNRAGRPPAQADSGGLRRRGSQPLSPQRGCRRRGRDLRQDLLLRPPPGQASSVQHRSRASGVHLPSPGRRSSGVSVLLLSGSR